MNISRNSWHYKIMSMTHGEHPDNLCQYFWYLMGALAMALLFVSAVAACGMLLLMPLLLIAEFTPELMLISTISAGAWCGIAIACWRELVPRDIQRKGQLSYWLDKYYDKHPVPEKERAPSIVFEYLKANKQKVCPRITFHYGD